MNMRNLLALIAVAMVTFPFPAQSSGTDGSNAANKTAAAGSTVEILGNGVSGGSNSMSATVLATSIKTSPPQDLLFTVSLECALWTTVKTVGNDVSESTSRVTVTVFFDGNMVPISSDDADGSVVFCDRTHQQSTSGFDDENATIKQYLATRTANAFSWVLPNVGGGTHSVEVVAELSGTATDNAFTQAGIGHRTLVVEPVHLAQGATVTNTAPAASHGATATTSLLWGSAF
ncbi:MAG: hypothetical protein V4510_12625 [bacterium]